MNIRIALAAGSGRGIGRSIALNFASRSVCLVISDLDVEPADVVVGKICQLGRGGRLRRLRFGGEFRRPADRTTANR